MQPAAVILLNGASSAGKSTLAKALQARIDAPFLHFSLDLLMFGGGVPPARRDPAGPFSWPVMRPRLFDGFFACLAALAGAGNNLIVDHVVEGRDQRHEIRERLAPFDVFAVGLHCPLPELERRKRARGDRRIGDASRDDAVVHTGCAYDAEVDATLPAEHNAVRLAAAWQERRRPGVFGTWAA